MNEQDKDTVEGAKLLIYLRIGASDLVHDLVPIIDRLDKQLAEIKEAGEPFVTIAKTVRHDDWWTHVRTRPGTQTEKAMIHKLMGSDFRRLAQVLKGVKEP